MHICIYIYIYISIHIYMHIIYIYIYIYIYICIYIIIVYGAAGYEMPEWKKLYLGKNVSFGIKSTLSIAEQRRSLPIFKLKEQLLKAITNNQVLIVIGETGSGMFILTR